MFKKKYVNKKVIKWKQIKKFLRYQLCDSVGVFAFTEQVRYEYFLFHTYFGR